MIAFVINWSQRNNLLNFIESFAFIGRRARSCNAENGHHQSVSTPLLRCTALSPDHYRSRRDSIVLDNAATVDEAIGLLLKTRLRVLFFSVHRSQVLQTHWGICDARGDCATVDVIDGEWQYTKSTAPMRFICANEDEDALALQYDRIWRGNLPLSDQFVQQPTFPRYTNMRFFFEHPEALEEDRRSKQSFCSSDALPSAVQSHFHMLDRSTLHSWNKYQTVLDSTNRVAYFRARDAPDRIKTVHLSDINSSLLSEEPVQVPIGLKTRAYSATKLHHSEFHVPNLCDEQTDLRLIAAQMDIPMVWEPVLLDHTRRIRALNDDSCTDVTLDTFWSNRSSFEKQCGHEPKPVWWQRWVAYVVVAWRGLMQ